MNQAGSDTHTLNQFKEMKTTLLDLRHRTAVLVTFLASAVATPQIGTSQAVGGAQQVIPLIQMEQVPLVDAIRNLARQEGINYLLNPRVSSSSVGPGSRLVNLRWTNLTAHEALCRLLNEHQLAMFTNPATPIVRITFTNQPVRPVLVSLAGGDTNRVIPLITIADVPLADAIRNLARQAQVKVAFDPALPVPSPGPASTTISEYQVSVRWEKVTARQALVELLDNYDLVMVQDDPATSSARIITKDQAEAGSAQKPGQERR
jgi:hypothetical protein